MCLLNVRDRLQLTHLLISAHRQSHSVAVMMPGLRTIPDTKYTNYMTVLNLFYAYYTEKNLACGAPYRTFNTYDTNKTAVPFRRPVLKRTIPSQIWSKPRTRSLFCLCHTRNTYEIQNTSIQNNSSISDSYWNGAPSQTPAVKLCPVVAYKNRIARI